MSVVSVCCASPPCWLPHLLHRGLRAAPCPVEHRRQSREPVAGFLDVRQQHHLRCCCSFPANHAIRLYYTHTDWEVRAASMSGLYKRRFIRLWLSPLLIRHLSATGPPMGTSYLRLRQCRPLDLCRLQRPLWRLAPRLVFLIYPPLARRVVLGCACPRQLSGSSTFMVGCPSNRAQHPDAPLPHAGCGWCLRRLLFSAMPRFTRHLAPWWRETTESESQKLPVQVRQEEEGPTTSWRPTATSVVLIFPDASFKQQQALHFSLLAPGRLWASVHRPWRSTDGLQPQRFQLHQSILDGLRPRDQHLG